VENIKSFREGEIVKGNHSEKKKIEGEKADLLDWLLAIDASLA
jgi:hypothetical protein